MLFAWKRGGELAGQLADLRLDLLQVTARGDQFADWRIHCMFYLCSCAFVVCFVLIFVAETDDWLQDVVFSCHF